MLRPTILTTRPHISGAVAVARIAVPVALFKASLAWLCTSMIGAGRTVVTVAAGVLAALAGSIGLAAAGVSVPACLLVIVLALGVSIVTDERRGSELAWLSAGGTYSADFIRDGPPQEFGAAASAKVRRKGLVSPCQDVLEGLHNRGSRGTFAKVLQHH
jgi:hypothetical protein